MSDGTPDAKAIFFEALDQKSAEELQQYLDEACGDDRELRSRVQGLLRAHRQAGNFLGGASPADATTDQPLFPEQPGMHIGPYRLLDKLGEGGMGVVFLAEQKEPVERQVALKIIRPGMDTERVIDRFEAERQALAVMDHPNVAKVLDAGRTDSGRPYFVMELVQGTRITQYCDDHQLSVRERLELFIPVCQAVQHAHQKGIIHRDIKPSNILVAEFDGRPVPKVIDFGVAKAIDQRTAQKQLSTQYGQIVGTLEYMSPEQARLSSHDIDTRSDVYSLGAVLYELLTGITPFDKHKLYSAAFDQALHMIEVEEPPKPSLRLSSSDSLPSVAALRNVEPQRLAGLIRGELDWIVMKALEKDRIRRYETANGLAADIERYLGDEPVLACPPSAAYRVRKFVRRNKGPVAAVCLLLLALVSGILGTTWGLVRAERARRAEAERAEAERQAKDAERKAKETAEAHEAETRAVLDFVENKIFAAARPEGLAGGLGREVTLRSALEAALPFVETGFTDQPLIEARLRFTLGQSFGYLGQADRALEQFQAAELLYRQHCGPDDPDTLRCMDLLARTFLAVGREADAVKLHEKTLELRKAASGPDDHYTLVSMNNLADAYAAVGRHAEALKLRQETLPRWKAKLGPTHRNTLRSMHDLASSYLALGRLTEALALHQETLDLWIANYGPDDRETLWSMHDVAYSYSALGRHADALKLQRQTLAIRTSKLGPDHPDTLASMEHISLLLFALGRRDEAFKMHEDTLARTTAKFGRDHPVTLQSMCNLAGSYLADGQYAAALKLYQETFDVRAVKLGANDARTLNSLQGVADALIRLNRGAEAVQMIDQRLQRAAGSDVDPTSISGLAMARLRYFVKAKDAVGCRATAEIWEKLKRTDSGSLYDAACMRTVTASVVCADDKSPTAVEDATVEADQAMAWLRQAIAAGYKDDEHLKNDKDLDALRDREDFKTLVAELEKGKERDAK